MQQEQKLLRQMIIKWILDLLPEREIVSSIPIVLVGCNSWLQYVSDTKKLMIFPAAPMRNEYKVRSNVEYRP